MTEIVRDPRSEQLPQRDWPQFRVFTGQAELHIGHTPLRERGEVFRAQARKIREQFGQRSLLDLSEPGEPIEWGETALRALGEDNASPGDPVGALPVDQVAQNLVRTPRARPFVRGGPLSGETAERRV